jgi:hypothetical protein
VSILASSLPAPSPDVVFRALPDGGVLFCPRTEEYFGLNVTGAFVWEHLRPVCDSVEDLVAAFQRRFPDAPDGAARQDVLDLLNDLTSAGLIV